MKASSGDGRKEGVLPHELGLVRLREIEFLLYVCNMEPCAEAPRHYSCIFKTLQ